MKNATTATEYKILQTKYTTLRREADILWAEALASQRAIANFHSMVCSMENNVADTMQNWRKKNDELNDVNCLLYPYQVEMEIKLEENGDTN